MMEKLFSPGKKVFLKDMEANDYEEFAGLIKSSRKFLHPWIILPSESILFENLLRANLSENSKTFTIRSKEDGGIAGIINLSNIIRGNFQCGFLGYYMGKRYANKGYMTEGMMLALKHIFNNMKLHRVEANIQPGNISSIKLAQRCGFEKEGFSPRYLKINKRWRDHERWAITAEGWAGARRRAKEQPRNN